MASRTAITYTATGAVASVTDPDGNTTTYDYNGQGELVTMTNALGPSTVYTYNSTGLVGSETDADGNVRTYSYDSENRLVAENWYDPQGEQVDALRFSYNAAGQLTRPPTMPGRTPTPTIPRAASLASPSRSASG